MVETIEDAEHYAYAPAIIKRIIMETPHGLFCETLDGIYWMVPKHNVTPSRIVIPLCYCTDTWQGRH